MRMSVCLGAAVPSPGPLWRRVRRREVVALRAGAAAQEGGGGSGKEKGIPNGGHHQGSPGEVSRFCTVIFLLFSLFVVISLLV